MNTYLGRGGEDERFPFVGVELEEGVVRGTGAGDLVTERARWSRHGGWYIEVVKKREL